MKRKNRKIDTSHKRCREYIKFRVIQPAIVDSAQYKDCDIFTIEGIYNYGTYRKK